MVKAFVDLDMNTKDINSALAITATGTIRSNAQFNRNGENGLTQVIVVFDGITTSTFTFSGGILTVFSETGGH